MRFLSIYTSPETSEPPSPEHFAKMQALVEEGIKEGYLLATEGCLPSALGARVRLSNGQITVTDGPFVESKELVGGFAILQADSKEEAIELAKRFMTIAGDGACEIRQLYTQGECGGAGMDVHADVEAQFAS